MAPSEKHEHPGGDVPHRHAEGDELATHGTGRAGTARDDSERTLELREEELQARKQSVETGKVRVGTEIVSEQKTLEVPVTREEVTIERHPVERRPVEGIIGEEEKTIRVPVHEEQVTVEKRAVVTEEINVGKRAVQETKEVAGTVRREEARVENTGNVKAGGASTSRATGTWNEVLPGYRARWQQRYGSSGGRWEDYEPSYRYGHEMRSQPAYSGRKWNEVESDFQSDWTRRNPNTPWDRAKESVREAWEGTTDR